MLIYTGANEVVGNKAYQWTTRWWDAFYFGCFVFLNFCVYIKIPKKKDIFWDTIWDSCKCLYVN